MTGLKCNDAHMKKQHLPKIVKDASVPLLNKSIGSIDIQ